MPNWIVADDTSPYIAYAGAWERQVGSSRQWQQGVHSTSQVGATATFRWRGTGIRVRGTIPVGDGLVRSTYSIDGANLIVPVERQSGTDAVYNDLFLEQMGLREGEHTLVITNTGTDADLRIDKIDFYPLSDPATETPLDPVAPVSPTEPGTNIPAPTSQTTRTTFHNTAMPSATWSSTDSTGSDSTTTTSPTFTSPSQQSSDNTIISTSSSSSRDPNSGTTLAGLSDGDHTMSASGSEAGTLVLRVSDGITYTVTQSEPRETGGALGDPHSRDMSLSKGALAGIIVGSILTLFAVFLLVFILVRRYRRRRTLLLARAQELEKGEVHAIGYISTGPYPFGGVSGAGGDERVLPNRPREASKSLPRTALSIIPRGTIPHSSADPPSPTAEGSSVRQGKSRGNETIDVGIPPPSYNALA